MKRFKGFLLLCLTVTASGIPYRAGAQNPADAVYQWSVSVDGRLDHHPGARAFLWIPPDCRKVRAVILAQNNMEESSILDNPVFRRILSRLGFAEVWVSPSFDHLFRFTLGSGKTFDKMMDDLAGESGYRELRDAPIVAIGHSAAASWPYYFAAWDPGRTLAAISVSGQWPYFRSPVFAPDIWSKDQNIDGVPALETMGEYENGGHWALEGLRERKDHPLMPLTMLACPAEGHFASTDKKAAFLGFYIEKAAHCRLPARYPGQGPVVLRPVNPERSGWLVPAWKKNSAPGVRPAPVGAYKGNPDSAFWCFDEETARVVMAYESAYRNLKPQTLGYMQQGRVVPQHETHQQVDLRFLPEQDGRSFTLHARYLDTVPGGSHFPASWTGLPVGAPVGHSPGAGAIRIERVSGPLAKTGPGRFQVRFSRGMDTTRKNYELWFIAEAPGDEVYKPAILQAEMLIPARNEKGRPQHIDFPAIPDQAPGASAVRLQARSDAGLPVQYYVRQGPARVEGNTLVFTPLPVRCRLPVAVTVVACQYGTASGAGVRTAVPVSRTFFIGAARPVSLKN